MNDHPTRTLMAFYGRCSTEDQQDPTTSLNWQLSRARALIEPRGGIIVRQYFDVGESRSTPWIRRPQAAELLATLADPHRGFTAVVIGEPHRAFYGNQFGLTLPVFSHYGLRIWVPEVGGPIDPDNEGHDMIMSVFGGMSKGERTRIKVRVRTAMASQTIVEGRYLGGRPPYGYILIDAGPHPNPGKAADGKRLHRLDIDPIAAPVVQRIFRDYLHGHGIYAIAEALTRDNIPCPSAHDRARNSHRTALAWSKMAIRAILINPRYTGFQVWNKQRKDEVLLDVTDVALGHTTKLRWNQPDKWVWSEKPSHPAIVTKDDFDKTQAKLATKGASTTEIKPRRTTRTYMFRGALFCGLCARRMQGQIIRDRTMYRCRYPSEYADTQHLRHPKNVYLREDHIIEPLDQWLATALAPHHLRETITAMHTAELAQPNPAPDHTQMIIEECDRKLTNYRKLLDAGTDPTLIATWITETSHTKLTAIARQTTRTPQQPPHRLSEDNIKTIITYAGDIKTALRNAEPASKHQLYQQLNLKMTYHPATQTVRAESNIKPDYVGIGSVSEGGLEPPSVAYLHRTGMHATKVRTGTGQVKTNSSASCLRC